MYVPEELKLNRFMYVHIPSNKDYFTRFTGREMPENVYTGDEPAVMPQNKIDQILEADAEFREQLNNE